MAGGCAVLSDAIARYVALQQALGHKFHSQTYLLQHFARAAAARGEDHVRAETAVAWASEAPSPRSRRDRLAIVRHFARVMALEDPRYEVPPALDFGRIRPRPLPHIFTHDEVERLLRAAAALAPVGSLRPLTYATLFALLVATGLRISEALALRLDDVTADGLVIRYAKYRKHRLVPLEASTRRGLEHYLAARARLRDVHPTVFVSVHGGALPYPTVERVFLELMRQLGLRGAPGQRGPRIHDFRHTFAVRALERAAGDRDAIRRQAAALATYLGHASIANTYWYLQATPLLLREIADAAEELVTGAAP